MIDLSSVLKVGEDGYIGEEMLVMTPALVRDPLKDGAVESGGGSSSSNSNDGNKVTVCKSIVLVRLDEAMGKRGRWIRALRAWTPS